MSGVVSGPHSPCETVFVFGDCNSARYYSYKEESYLFMGVLKQIVGLRSIKESGAVSDSLAVPGLPTFMFVCGQECS